MENLTLNGKTITFDQVSGTVLTAQKINETHITSSGGGGYMHNGGGYVHAPQLHSTIITNQEFWIQTKSGKEIHVSLSNSDIPLRVGQNITLIDATTAQSSAVYRTLLVNHSAKLYWTITNGRRLNRRLEIDHVDGAQIFSYFIGYVLLWFAGAWLLGKVFTASSSLPMYLAAGMLVILFFVTVRLRENRERAVDKAIDAHLGKLAQCAFRELA